MILRKTALAVLVAMVAVSVFAKKEEGTIKPTLENVAYGDHPDQTLNFWKADSDKPTPVIVHIHGGGWFKGAKDEVTTDKWLSGGISYVSIDYRLNSVAHLPAPVYDAVKAVQFVRAKAKEWNIDKTRLACTGNSAGGCSSLWLALHDDMAKPESDDPVERESSKPTCVFVSNPQSSLDPFWIEKNIGPKGATHGMIYRSVGAPKLSELKSNYEKYRKLTEEFSPILHLDKEDPPVAVLNNRKIEVPAKSTGRGIHHPMFGIKLKEKADEIGADNVHLFIPHYGDPEKFKTSEAMVEHYLLRTIVDGKN